HLRKGHGLSAISDALVNNHGYDKSFIERRVASYKRSESNRLVRSYMLVFFILLGVIFSLFLIKPSITGFVITYPSVNGTCLDSCLASNDSIWTALPITSSWQKNNSRPGGEGMQMVWDIDWNIHDTDTLYLVTDTTRVWRSSDGGQTWNNIGLEIPAKGGASIVSDPTNESIVLVAASKMDSSTLSGSAEGIWKSENGGQNWTQVLSSQNYSRSKHGKLFLFDNTSFDGLGSQVIFAGSDAGLWKSDDGGDSWNLIDSLGGEEVFDLEWASADRTILYVATNESLYSFNSTSNLSEQIGLDLPGVPYDVAVDYEAPESLFVATQGGIYNSSNGGLNFSLTGTGLNASLAYRHVTISPSDKNRLFACPHLIGGLYPYYSDDYGATWHIASDVNQEEFVFSGWYYSEPIIFHPQNSLVAITQRDSPMAITTDGGQSWHYSGSGMIGSRLKDISFFNETTMVFCMTDYGLFLTEDGGTSFRDLSLMRRDGLRTCSGVDTNGSTIIASSGGWESQDIVISYDFGNTWGLAYDANSILDHIRYNPSNASRVYADNYVSLDGGSSWNLVADGYDIRKIDPFNDSIIYGMKDLGSTYQVARSTDDGASWTVIGSTLPTADAFDLDVDPFNETLHMLVAGGYHGIYEYKDGGSWTLLASGAGLTIDDSNFEFVRFDTRLEGIVWTGQHGFRYHGSGIYLSRDYGTTWSDAMKNLGPYNDAWDISISPFDSKVYLTAAGIWTSSFETMCSSCFTVSNESNSSEENTNVTACTLSSVSWNEDSSLSNAFNLSYCFDDPQNNTLNYSVSGNSSIRVSIGSDGMVNLSAPADWYGSESVSFTAVDSSNVSRNATTNSVALTVMNVADCGDLVCEPGETCSSCEVDCGSCSSGGGGGGGGGGAATTDKDWICGDWGECINYRQVQVCEHNSTGAVRMNSRTCDPNAVTVVDDSSSGSSSSGSANVSEEVEQNVSLSEISSLQGLNDTPDNETTVTLREPELQSPASIFDKEKIGDPKYTLMFGGIAALILIVFLLGNLRRKKKYVEAGHEREHAVKLRDYMTKAKERGMSRHEVRSSLLDAGWREEVADELIHMYYVEPASFDGSE
ncbi:hypothetical protein JW711_02815, partial [Candidatus Woesearchaeota archaeon]|nr:hypothetical protein [Candidatus Woesearchaeota archaeon]